MTALVRPDGYFWTVSMIDLRIIHDSTSLPSAVRVAAVGLLCSLASMGMNSSSENKRNNCCESSPHTERLP